QFATAPHFLEPAASKVNDSARRIFADASAIIAEALIGAAIRFETREQWLEQRHDLARRHEVLQEEVEPCAEHIAADEYRVLVTGAADDTDVALVGPDAAVRAAGDADADCLALQAEARQLGFELIDDAGQDAFGFRDGQAAGWDRRAGEAVLAGLGQLM